MPPDRSRTSALWCAFVPCKASPDRLQGTHTPVPVKLLKSYLRPQFNWTPA